MAHSNANDESNESLMGQRLKRRGARESPALGKLVFFPRSCGLWMGDCHSLVCDFQLAQTAAQAANATEQSKRVLIHRNKCSIDFFSSHNSRSFTWRSRSLITVLFTLLSVVTLIVHKKNKNN